MTEITDLSPTDSSNTTVTGESIDGAIANMGRMDNTLQAILGLLARSIRTNVLRFLDNADPTKKVALDLTGLPTATERTWTAPYYSGTLGLVSDIRGQIYGLTLSNNGADAVTIAAGSAVDSTGTVSMVQATSLTKNITSNWAVGTGQGWLDTGSVTNGTFYYSYEIRRPDTGVVDNIGSLSAVSPLLPTNYTQYRRIGAVVRGSGTLLQVTQDGDYFWYNTVVTDVNAVTLGTSDTDYVLSVPRIAGVKAIIQGQNTNASAWVLELHAKGLAVGPAFIRGAAGVPVNFGQAEIRVNSSAQITARSSVASSSLTIWTMGWVDTRGKDS